MWGQCRLGASPLWSQPFRAHAAGWSCARGRRNRAEGGWPRPRACATWGGGEGSWATPAVLGAFGGVGVCRRLPRVRLLRGERGRGAAALPVRGPLPTILRLAALERGSQRKQSWCPMHLLFTRHLCVYLARHHSLTPPHAGVPSPSSTLRPATPAPLGHSFWRDLLSVLAFALRDGPTLSTRAIVWTKGASTTLVSTVRGGRLPLHFPPPPPTPPALLVGLRSQPEELWRGGITTMAPYLCANCRRSHFSPTGAVMDSASRTCFCSVECAWTLRFRQQTAAMLAARAAAAQRAVAAQAAVAAPQPAPRNGQHGYAAYGAGAADGGGGDRSAHRGAGGHGAHAARRAAAYGDPFPHVRREDEEEKKDDRGAALQQTARLLRNGGPGTHVRCDDQAPTGETVDSESDSSSPSWDCDDSRYHAMFDWQALDKDQPFGTFSRMH